MYVSVILVSVLILIPTIALGVLYFLFSRTPEKRWQSHVFRLRHLAQKLRQQEILSLRHLGEEFQCEERQRSERAFGRCLDNLAVEKLEAFPGIGSGTTTRLRQSGYTTLAKLQGARIQIHGLGAKRLADIYHGVDMLTRSTWARFRADSGSPERAELDRDLQSLRDDLARREFMSRNRIAGTEAFLDKLQGLLHVAEAVTFTGYLGLTKKAVIAPEYLNAALPSFDDHMQAVNDNGNKLWRERQGQLPGRELPVPTPAAPGPSRAPAADGRGVLIKEKPPRVERPAPAVAGARATSRAQPEVIQPRVSAPVETRAIQPLDTVDLAIQLAFAVARADGRLAQAEKSVIDEHIDKIYSSDQPLLSRARALCAHYEAAAIDVDDCLRRIKDRFDSPGRSALVKLAIDIAAASGGIKQREQDFLSKVSRSLDIPLPPEVLLPQAPAPAAAVAQSPHTPESPAPLQPAAPADPRTLLEIEPGTPLSADLIRRHFHRLWERLDPEKMTGMGADFVAMAQAKRAALREAACTLIEPFGEELEPRAVAAPARDIRANPDLDQVFGV